MERKQNLHTDAGETADLAALSINDLQQRLKCSLEGLDAAEARRRLTEVGYNELPADKVNPLLKFPTYFWEEFQAGNAIAALQAKLALNARVNRDGRWSSVPARELVPGDVIRVRLGDIVPADAKLLEGESSVQLTLRLWCAEAGLSKQIECDLYEQAK